MVGKKVFSGQFGERLLFCCLISDDPLQENSRMWRCEHGYAQKVAVFPTPSSGAGVVFLILLSHVGTIPG